GVLRRAAVALAVPALHRVDREAVSDLHAVDLDGRGKRRGRAVRDDVVARHVEAEGGDVIAEPGDAVERTDLGIVTELHAFLRTLFRSAASARRDVGQDDVDAVLPALVALLLA